MIEHIYRSYVSMVHDCGVESEHYSRALQGHDILYEIHTRNELAQEFGKDFIVATRGSFNAQTDGYNGSMFADFVDITDANLADAAMQELAVKWTQKVLDVLAEEEAEFHADQLHDLNGGFND